MCRGGTLGTCSTVGCDSPITCRDTGGYCNAHDLWSGLACECDEDPCVCGSDPRPATDPVKLYQYELGLAGAAVANAELSLERARRVLRERQAALDTLQSKARP